MAKSREKVTDANINYLKDETRNHGNAILVDLQKLKVRKNDQWDIFSRTIPPCFMPASYLLYIKEPNPTINKCILF